ncbi:MAG: dihydroorotate dehydrogenase (quinone) [Hyphomicrobiales bacterium]|nr:MAG: dihydroorotate dehydrogenase (quinone) [Hyphomicrobiales bacterium]
MKNLIASIGKRALLCLDAERAHELTISALKTGLMSANPLPVDPVLEIKIKDLTFPNPLGMAAGFDKNAEVPDAVLGLGFGFTEIGTITPRRQTGNPKPRVFRSPRDGVVINRYGFNNEGHDAAYRRLVDRVHRPGIVGVNIGANKDSSDRIADYVSGVNRFASLASYFTVNVSSPNTPGLRDLQAKAALDELMARVIEARDAQIDTAGRSVPVFLKIAPDVTDEDLDDIAAVVETRNVDGLIVSNTTLARNGVSDPLVAQEAGGMSGAPLFEKSTIMLAKTRLRVGMTLPIIGVGGVTSAASAFEKFRAGATLVQLYTGLVYGGPDMVGEIVRGLSIRCKSEGFAHISEATGSMVEEWAKED